MIALEHVSPDDWEAVRRAFDTLMRLVIDTGGKTVGLRYGLATGTWPGGSPRANNTTVPHNLGALPVVALASVTQSPSGTWFPVPATFTYTSTSFLVTAVTSDGSSPAAATAYTVVWVAIG